MTTVLGTVASSSVVVEAVAGRSRCTTLRCEPPLTLRMADDGLYLVGTTAGPVGGDRLSLAIDVGPGARLHLRSAAATLVMPGPDGVASTTTTTARVAGGAALRWSPQPIVLVGGCDHRTEARIELARGGSLMWREETVLGRHREGTGSLLQRLRIDRDGLPLLRSDLAVGPRWPASDGPARLAGFGAVGSLVLVGAAAHEVEQLVAVQARRSDATHTAVLRLCEDAAIVTALGLRLDGVSTLLDDVEAAAAGPAHHQR